jgi:hypothetical protein
MPDKNRDKISYLIKDITTDQIINKIEFDQTALARIFESDMQDIRNTFVEHLRKKYPADKYQIIEDKDFGEELRNVKTFQMHASAQSLLTVNIAGIVIGIFLLLLLLTIRHLYTLGLFIVGIIVIAVYMITDYLIWQKRGIHTIELDAQGITVYRGKNKIMQRIDRRQITEINIFKKIKRRIVTIMLGGEVIKPNPGITLFKGSRLRIADDAFNDAQFSVFIEKLKQFKIG